MNILPKKRWHVRTKDNIARVRRDEAEAREQERKRTQKQEFAESEARINFLRKQSGLPERQNVEDIDAGEDAATTSDNGDKQHVDLFADYKSHIRTTNKELEKEKKEEQEKYEKQIGYLTYLGQDTNEALKLRSWYEVAPKRAVVGDKAVEEKDLKNKHTHDPLTLINTLLPANELSLENRQTYVARNENEQTHIARTRKRSIEKVSTELPVKRVRTKDKSHKAKKCKKEKKHKKDKILSKEKRIKKEQRREEKFALEAEELRRKQEKLEKLRKERLRREASERARQEALLAPPKPMEPAQKDPKTASMARIVQKYNSQFNPELAKQNML